MKRLSKQDAEEIYYALLEKLERIKKMVPCGDYVPFLESIIERIGPDGEGLT